MILRLLHAGSPGRGPLDEAAGTYRQRLSRHDRVDETFVKAERLRREDRATVASALATEGERLLATLGPRDHLVALAVDGARWSSTDLARQLERWRGGSHRAVVFALGSAHGLAPAVTKRAAQSWSFGPLTLPHDLARVVLWEQLYRAATIVRGEPYHK